MKFYFQLLTLLSAFSINALSQTIYVPLGTSGIGTSSTSNVGIGVSNPAEKLVINGSIRGNQSGALRISTGNGYIDVGPKTTNFAGFYTDRPYFYFDKELRINSGYIGSSNGDLFFNTNGTTNLTILSSNGNVGIGVTNPRHKLEVNGHIFLGGDNSLRIGDDNLDDGSLRITNVPSCFNTYADYSNNLYFRVAGLGGSTMALQQNGTVVIGAWEKYDDSVIDCQGNKLLINGGIMCEQVKVISNVPDADYVFDENYKIKSLAEIEKYIKENKHLPDVPSAQEFKKEGYILGDMDEILLRKIEELTLYMIEQDKIIKNLKEKLDNQK